jgi:hypothetical protein
VEVASGREEAAEAEAAEVGPLRVTAVMREENLEALRSPEWKICLQRHLPVESLRLSIAAV